MSPSLLVVAGEISGDQHAADVVRRVRATLPDLTVWGIGGDALAAVGVSLRQHTRDMAVMGLIEVLRRIGFFRRVLGDLVQEARRTPPDAALLVDYPGFNLLVWGLPFLAVVAGGGVVYLVAHRWAEQKPGDRPTVDPAYAERVRRELKDREHG
jgi:hypothetical protein